MTTHQALYLMVGEVKGELHYLKKVIFFACIFILINTAYRCLMQQLTEVFRMVTKKEREDSAQPRNKVNLRALEIQNGFYCL